ncbi:MAG: FAD-binding oxidoreductase [Acidobacteriia bacterium]|nr:FAD-binding oxidoreductase [Terriglobia bacterium]
MTPIVSAALMARLEALAGAANIVFHPDKLQAYAVDAIVPGAAARPESAGQAAEIVRFAAAEKLAVIPVGGCSKLGMGQPPSRYDLALDLTRLDRIAHYDPGDLTLSVDAGMSVARLAALLAEHNQFIPLEAPWWEQATVGGTVAAGVDSPLRQFYGTTRDFIIGAEFVTAAGTLAKSGGRVVKNVTGYDLHKLAVGSLGTLAALTRVNFRTFPLAQSRRGFLASFSQAGGAIELRKRIAASPLTPASLEIISPEAARRISAAHAPMDASLWHVLAGFEGTETVVARYERDLARLGEAVGSAEGRVVGEAGWPVLRARLREAIPLLLAASPAAAVCRVCVLPGKFDEVFETLRAAAGKLSLQSAILARGTGAVYFALLPERADEDALTRLAQAGETVFKIAAAAGGQASIPWCPVELKKKVSVWGPARADFALMRRVKNAFDPAGLFAPGRFAGGL